MSMYAALYCYENDLMGQRTRRKIAIKAKIRLLDLCRPDVYMIHDVDRMIGIWMWLKGEIQRLTEDSSYCTHFYHHCKTTALSGSSQDYIACVREAMSRIMLGIAKESGRDKFDAAYPLDAEIIVPVRYYKSHAPLEFGECQRNLLAEITTVEKPIRLTWSPNPCHKRANVVFKYILYFNPEGFWWTALYSYARDRASWWDITISPKPGQMLVDFMLDIQAWLRAGLPKTRLEQTDGEWSETYTLKNKEAK